MSTTAERILSSPPSAEVLRAEIIAYFSEHVRKGYTGPFNLVRLELSEINLSRNMIYAVPCHPGGSLVDEEIDEDDHEWHRGLNEIGKRHGTGLDIPYWCWMK